MQQVVAASTALQPAQIIPRIDAGQALDQIVAQAIADGFVSRRFWWHGAIELSHLDWPGQPARIDPENWHRVRPKRGTIVHLYLTPAGGGGGGNGGKNFLGALTSVFLLIGVAAISGGALAAVPFLGAGFGAGTVGASVAAAGVGLAGQLAIRALFPPPQQQGRDTDQGLRENRASLRDNILAPGQTLPRVIGTHVVAPPMIMQPHRYLAGDDIFINAAYALAGPHAITGVRVDDVPAEDLEDFEYWIDDGTAPARTNRFSEYAFTDRFNRELSRHKLRGEESGFANTDLIDQEDPNQSMPQWERFRTRRGCAFADVNLAFIGLYDAGAGATDQLVYLRLRGRKTGDTAWRNIQTFAYVGRSQNLRNRRMRLHFGVYPGSILESPLSRDGFRSPVTLLPVQSEHFNFKTGDSARFPAAHSFDFIRLREGIDVWLNASYWLDGDEEYEWEIKRSEMTEKGDLDDIDQMEFGSGIGSGDRVDFFDAELRSGSWRAQEDDTDQSDRVILESVVSVYEAEPIVGNPPIATLHVRLKNFEAQRVTVEASGLVPDLVGGNWTGQVATSNPAAHYRYMLAGDQSVDQIDAPYLDAGLDDWHAECAAQGYECNDVLDGTLDDALKRVAACGRAKPFFGMTYGVIYDRDTSAEGAVQMFTPRNTRNLTWEVAYSRRPTGFVVEFINRDNNYQADELFVADPFAIPGATTEIESVRYPGLVTEDQVRSRAEFDFEQARLSTLYQFEIGIEHLATIPGDIAILSHDAMHRHAAWGRVTEIVSGTQIRVDTDIAYDPSDDFFSAADFFTLDDVFFTGVPWAVEVRNATHGVNQTGLTSWDGATKIAEVADTSLIGVGDLAVFGPVRRMTMRVQVVSVEPQGLDLARVVVRETDVWLRVWRISVGAALVAVEAQNIDVSGLQLTVVVDAAQVAVAAQDVLLERALQLSVDAASVAVVAQDVGLDIGFGLTIDAAQVALAVQDVGLLVDYVLPVEVATVAVAAQDVSLQRSLALEVGTATVAVAAQDVGLSLAALLLLSGDEQSGSDRLLLSGDQQVSGSDAIKLSGDQA